MKIHTDHLVASDLHGALASCGLKAEGVAIDLLVPRGSRSRHHGFEVHLAANPGTDRFGKRRRHANTGHNGADSANYAKAATYAEWGVWIAALMNLDPEMIFGPYKGLNDFHQQTRNQFMTEVAA